MKPENSEKVIELLNARASLQKMQSKIEQAQPGTLEYISIKPGVHLDAEKCDFGMLTIRSLERIRSSVLEEINHEIEQIDSELEDL